MPIPRPIQNQSEDDFMISCMSNTFMMSDYTNPDERFSICASSWSKGPEVLNKEVKYFLELTKAYKKNGKVWIQGIAGGTLEDVDGEKQNLSVLQKFADHINNYGLPITNAHQKGGIVEEDLGTLSYAEIIERDARYDLFVKGTLDTNNPLSKIFLEKVNAGKKFGLSIEGIKAIAREVFSEKLGRKIREFVDAIPRAVSITTTPAYMPSFIEVLEKSANVEGFNDYPQSVVELYKSSTDPLLNKVGKRSLLTLEEIAELQKIKGVEKALLTWAGNKIAKAATSLQLQNDLPKLNINNTTMDNKEQTKTEDEVITEATQDVEQVVIADSTEAVTDATKADAVEADAAKADEEAKPEETKEEIVEKSQGDKIFEMLEGITSRLDALESSQATSIEKSAAELAEIKEALGKVTLPKKSVVIEKSSTEEKPTLAKALANYIN